MGKGLLSDETLRQKRTSVSPGCINAVLGMLQGHKTRIRQCYASVWVAGYYCVCVCVQKCLCVLKAEALSRCVVGLSLLMFV